MTALPARCDPPGGDYVISNPIAVDAHQAVG
jgi:hypothetical protein